MLITFAVIGLFIMLAYEIRHRMTGEQVNYLDNEVHRLDLELKTLKENFTKKVEADKKEAAKPNPLSQL